MANEREDAEQILKQLVRGRSVHVRPSSELDELRTSLREATLWCEKHADPLHAARSLRPQALAPRVLAANRWDAVRDVTLSRRRYSSDSRTQVTGPGRGRLLVYFPDGDLACGAAEFESRGFFDVHNAPAWATWVGYFEDGDGDASYSNYVLAYVPQLLVPLVQAGIDVNPEECIVWLESTSVSLREIEHLFISA
jgi:hypothetical protein